MSRLSLFNSPLLLGFDHFERTLDRVAKTSSDGYPPYNIEQIGDRGLRITLAVAGFAMSDLVVQIEDSQLVIRGKQTDDQERTYLHRGIAARQFQRSFVLAEGIEVTGAFLDNGLLHVDLIRDLPPVQIRTVAIATPASAHAGRTEMGAIRRVGRDGEAGANGLMATRHSTKDLTSAVESSQAGTHDAGISLDAKGRCPD